MSVGEASGDALAAEVVDCIRDTREVHLTALAGPALRERADSLVGRSEDFSAMGLAEVVPRLPRLVVRGHRVRRAIARSRPDALVTVDSPGLNLRLARAAREQGTAVVHCVSPQVWAWRPHRAARIAECADTLCCLLPFEPSWYDPRRIRAVFTGHPLAQLQTGWHRPSGPIALFPGSRPDEVRRLWPRMRAAANRMRRQTPGLQFRIAQAPTIGTEMYGGLDAEVVQGIDAARGASAALSASGTVTLELACRGIPQAVVYDLHPLTNLIGRVWVRGVSQIALPNILAGREIIPESIARPQPEWMAETLLRLRSKAGQQQVDQLRPYLVGLNATGAAERIASEVLRVTEAVNGHRESAVEL